MRNRILYFGFLSSVFILSCDDDKLDINDLKLNGGYFIECYMKPGELYNLTATEIKPIFEDYILDYSIDFDVFIVDTDTSELLQSLFIDRETGFIYNFGSPSRLPTAPLDHVDLLVFTPNGDTLFATTKIPEPVSIQSTNWQSSDLTTTFLTSQKTDQNYYILIAEAKIQHKSDSTERIYEVEYMDLSSKLDEHSFEVAFQNKRFSEASQITIRLLRVTEENFRYQRSLEAAKHAGKDNISFPTPLVGNIQHGVGIFTCYTEDTIVLK